MKSLIGKEDPILYKSLIKELKKYNHKYLECKISYGDEKYDVVVLCIYINVNVLASIEEIALFERIRLFQHTIRAERVHISFILKEEKLQYLKDNCKFIYDSNF